MNKSRVQNASDQHHESANGDTLVEQLSHSRIGENAHALLGKLHDGVEMVKSSATTATKAAKQGIAATERRVKSNPWTSLGIAAGIGFVTGFLTRLAWRRSN